VNTRQALTSARGTGVREARHPGNRTAAGAVMLNPERDSVIRMTSVYDQITRLAA